MKVIVLTESELRQVVKVDHQAVAAIDPVIELGEITAGRKPGRQNDDQITICDLSGTGVQDTAIAHLAVEQAVQRGLGTEIEIGIGYRPAKS